MADKSSAAPKDKRDFFDLKALVAPILELDPHSPSWKILDANREEGLALCYFSENKSGPMDRSLSWLRGVIVDYVRGYVVATSYGTAETVVVKSFNLLQPMGDEDYSITLEGYFPLENGNISCHTRGYENVKGIKIEFYDEIKAGIEGTLLRTFLYKGKMYISSHRRLDFSNSHWGNGPTFQELWEKNNGPTQKDIFGDEEESPRVYNFILQDPALTQVSRDKDAELGAIVFVGTTEMWDPKCSGAPFNVMTATEDGEIVPLNGPPCPNKETIFFSDFQPNWFDLHEKMGVVVSHPGSRDELCHIVNQEEGFSESETLANAKGGFLIVYKYEIKPDGTRGGMYGLTKIESRAYAQRLDFHGGCSGNLWHRFVCAGTSFAKEERCGEIVPPEIANYPLEEIKVMVKETGYFSYQDAHSQEILPMGTFDERLYKFFVAFLMALPPFRHQEVVKFYEKYISEKGKLITWVKNIARKGIESHLSREDVCPRVWKIIELAVNNARENGCEKVGMINQVDINIVFLLRREDGMSLYKMFKNRNQCFPAK